MKLKNKKTIVTIVIAVVVVIALLLIFGGGKGSLGVTYKTSHAQYTSISTSVTATGTIEPVTTVDVGTQVSGIVSKIYVDYNSTVKAGQIIAELDKSTLISELNSAKANLAAAQATLASQESELTYQEENYNRQKTLHDKGLISDDAYDQAYKSYVQAKLSVNQQKQTVAAQKENVNKAETNLGYATITSPIDGVVLSKEVEEGQTVASSYSTPTLFNIAQDLTDIRVIADVDEADIGEVRDGQRVEFTVDAFPNDVFEGTVTQVRQEATTESNVVTYEVVITAPNNDLKLKPGLTANVTIYTSEKDNVLAVPSKALKFTPNETMFTPDETISDVEATHKVWVKEGNVFKAIAVETGITNGNMTEILSGLEEGQEVITEFVLPEDNVEEETTSNPFMPGPRNNNKKKSTSDDDSTEEETTDGDSPSGEAGAPSGEAGGQSAPSGQN